MRGNFRPFMRRRKNLRPLLSITFLQGFWKSEKKNGHLTLWGGGQKTSKRSEQMTQSVKRFFGRGDFTPFLSKNVKIWDHFIPLLFPKDSEYSKSLDIGLPEMGEKWQLSGVNKWKKYVKTYFAATILQHFGATKFKSETTSFHYFSPKIWNI